MATLVLENVAQNNMAIPYDNNHNVEDNFFDTFGMPVSFSINENMLTNVYLEKLRTTHPDMPKNCNSSQHDSAYINFAYKTLIDPITRAEYFLKMKNVDIGKLCSSNFALEMFEIREKHSSISSDEEKSSFGNLLKKRMEEILSSLYLCENNVAEFSDKVCLFRFISSFLEKAGINVYSRN